jgi:hypothetical protein
MPMIAMTTNNSTSVKARFERADMETREMPLSSSDAIMEH